MAKDTKPKAAKAAQDEIIPADPAIIEPAVVGETDEQDAPPSDEMLAIMESNSAAVEEMMQAAEPVEPGVNVAVLPVKFQSQRMTLEYPFDVTKGAHNLIISGKAYAVDEIKFNPYNKRQEIELAPVTLLEQAELDAMIASGWYVQG